MEIMERRTKAFVEAAVRAQDRLIADGDTRVVHEEILASLLLRIFQLELARVMHGEYLRFPELSFFDLMRSVEGWPTRLSFYFRMDFFGIPIMGLMAGDGLTSLYRLDPTKHLH
jgi:hypothetical protein